MFPFVKEQMSELINAGVLVRVQEQMAQIPESSMVAWVRDGDKHTISKDDVNLQYVLQQSKPDIFGILVSSQTLQPVFFRVPNTVGLLDIHANYKACVAFFDGPYVVTVGADARGQVVVEEYVQRSAAVSFEKTLDRLTCVIPPDCAEDDVCEEDTKACGWTTEGCTHQDALLAIKSFIAARGGKCKPMEVLQHMNGQKWLGTTLQFLTATFTLGPDGCLTDKMQDEQELSFEGIMKVVNDHQDLKTLFAESLMQGLHIYTFCSV